MSRLLGTPVFWTTVVAVPVLLAAMTLVGRLWSRALPAEFRPSAHFYLAPALGLAIFVLIASVLGRHLALGDTIVVPSVVLLVLIAARRFDPMPSGTMRQLGLTGLFGLLCGTSMLAPLYVNGVINAHNDTFTYLAQSDWLQQHAFGSQIPADQVTPATTQVLLYQLAGFRMGASYLLAFCQAVLNVRWSYDIYPAVAIAAIAACCLAIGFPVAELLDRLSPRLRLALLALPSFSLGGLVFGANQGFLPQTCGLALAAGAVFATGAALKWICSERRGVGSIVTVALPIAVLLAGVIFSYSEMVPFVVAAIGLSGLFWAIWRGAWRSVSIFGFAVALLTLIFCNFELLRTYNSLRRQAGAVVGSPVDWWLPQFFAHALGIQAGAWDTRSFTYYGLAWSAVLAVVVISSIRSISWKPLRSSASLLIPALLLLFSFCCGLIYFRYFVASPVSVGKGQSWSQFKLMEWAHPFTAVLVLAILASFLSEARTNYRRLMVVLLGAAALGSSYLGIARTLPLMNYYGNVVDLDAFYRNFRQTVFTVCPLSSSVYLALGGPDYKFRQLASVYLADRDLRSDWTDDGYIYPYIPRSRVNVQVARGDCLVEPSHEALSSTPATVIGPVRVGIFGGGQRIQIGSVDGAFDLETDGPNWWRWVEHRVTFSFKPLADRIRHSQVRIRFEYLRREDQPLQVEITGDVAQPPLVVEVRGQRGEGEFSRDIEIDRIEDMKISIVTTARAEPLSDKDQRKAAFMIRNLTVEQQ